MTLLKPLPRRERTGQQPLDCRRRRNNHRRSCPYTPAAYKRYRGPRFSAPRRLPSPDRPPLDQARRTEWLTPLKPLPRPERTGQHPLDCRRGRSNHRRCCPYNLAAYKRYWGPRFSVPGELPPPDRLPLAQVPRQGRAMTLKPQLLLERTGQHPLDCRRRRSNRQRCCQYSLAAYRPSREPPVFSYLDICHRKGAEVLPDCRRGDAVASEDGQRKAWNMAQNRRPTAAPGR